jgi:type I restriction enzyme R subunit
MNAKGQATSSNFGFLAKRYPQLERVVALSERYFSDDPIVSLMRVRQFGEAWRNWLPHARAYSPTRTNSRLTCCGVLVLMETYPRNVLDLFHQRRIAGNAATHRSEGDHATALGCLKMARHLGGHRRRHGTRPPTEPT